MATMDKKTCCQINKEYLPIKTHYFFLFGAMGGTVPYMTVLAKSLGINATAVGIIYTVLPFCVFLSKPIFGYITDFFRNIKVVMVILVIVTAASFLSVLLVPPIEPDETDGQQVQLTCIDKLDTLTVTPISHFSSCIDKSLAKGIKCKLVLEKCFDNSSDSALYGTLIGSKPENLNVSQLIRKQILLQSTAGETFFNLDQSLNESACDCFLANDTYLFCESCMASTSPSVYRSFTFWMFTFLAIIAGSGSATLFCLSDAACYEILGDNPHLYGHQRLWATISWGIVTSLSGYLNDIATKNSEANNYSPGFYLMLAFVLIDLLILWRISLVKANISTSIFRDVSKIFSSYDTVIFAFAVYIAGALTGLIWNYQFWFLQDLGADQTLLGLTIAVQCLVAEIPFFFFAGWFIRTFGYFNCLTASFVAFCLRTGIYSLLKNPWLTLPVEVFHGLTFALFYSSMNSYASEYAPPGTEATMLGVFGGLFEGLGVATGSLLGGVGFDTFGGQQTFFAASMISLICAPSFALAHCIANCFSSKTHEMTQSSSY